MSGYQYSEIELKLRAECEKNFPVGQSTSMYVAVTGEPYVEILGNVKDEGSPGQMSPTIEDAYSASLAAFREYAEGKSGAIYWRVHPELAQERSKWAFYMRLLISDSPVLKKDHPKVCS